jgi:hypothetical protein
MSAGFAGMTFANFSTKAERSRLRIGFQRFSKASVDIGFPLIPAPQTDAFRCVARGMQYFHCDISEIQLLAVRDCMERETDVCGVVQTVQSACSFGESSTARNVIGLNVGVNHTFDLHAFRIGELDVTFHIP